ncbi:unnamed protein product [Adineta ricciae]|uniref:F-box domain-containing protein n=1 Tax=Adineta ricciae TaxID=249248 RepID=A0A816B852_ADIRI|nr:unnamed protein product [Adineta ricciae]
MARLERLPAELFHEFFHYLWTHEILHSFSNLNDRFDSILKSYSSYRINFESIRSSVYGRICEQIRPEQVISLILSDKNDTPGLVKVFLSRVHIQQFTNLRLLSLIRISHESMCQILPELSKLKRLNSLSVDNSGGKGKFVDFIDKEKNENTKVYSLLPKSSPEIIFQLKYLCTTYSNELTSMYFPNLLQLRLNCYSLYGINAILQQAPQLKLLTLFLDLFDGFQEFQPCYSLRKLIIIIKYAHISINTIGQFLANFTNLMHFELKDVFGFADGSLIDGFRWQSIAQSFSTFSFKFKMKETLTERNLDSFRTRFWIEEKRWFVACHEQCLFAVPLSDFGLPYIRLTCMNSIHSTVPNNAILYQPRQLILPWRIPNTQFRFTSMRNLALVWFGSIQTLSSIIDLSQVQHLTIRPDCFSLSKDIPSYMPKLHTLYFDGHEVDRDMPDQSDLSGLQLKQIHTLQFCIAKDSKKSVYDLQMISHSFPSVEHLNTWPVKSRTDIIRIIGLFKQLSSISFVIHQSVDKTTRSSEFDSQVILNDIKQYLHYSAICRTEFTSVNDRTPELLHFWLRERVSGLEA